MKARLLLAGMVAAVLALGAPAQASVVSVFSVTPGSIAAGDSAELDLTLNLFADPGFKNAKFVGGLVTFGPDADHPLNNLEFFAITPGTTTQSFSFDFTYPNSGSFNPFYAFALTYSEQFSAGFFRNFTIVSGQLGAGETTLNVGEMASPVPDAPTWIMMLLGFAGIGFVGYQRKTRPAFRLA